MSLPAPTSTVDGQTPNLHYINVTQLDDAGAASGSLTQAAAMKLVFTGDVVLLALLAFAALLALPRTLARASALGHVLWYTSPRTLARRRQRARGPSPDSDSGKESWSGSDNSHTLTDYAPASLASGVAPRYPTHVRALGSLPVLDRLAGVLAARWRPGYSVGQFLLTQAYSTVLTSVLTYHSNIFTDPGRAGLVAMSQVPVVVALAMKNSLPGWAVGVGYEKMNFLHRYAGQMLVVFADIHALGYFYAWSLSGTFKQYATLPSNLWAFAALGALNLLLLTTPLRATHYRVFLAGHLVGLALFLPALCMHQPRATPYVLAALLLYAADHLLRAIKTKTAIATLRAMPDLGGGTTRIEIPAINGGWRAGQHVRVRVLSFKMGWLGWAEAHPFTIASVAASEEGMVLLVKKAGTWTGRLYELAKLGGYGEANESRARVLVEGPYGGGGALPASFSAALIVCGGSGISYATAQVEDLLRRDAARQSRVKSIDVLWTVRDPASLVPLIPLLTALLQQARAQSQVLRVGVHYTRATPGVVKLTPDYLVPGLSLVPGRPRVGKVLEGVIAGTLSYEGGKGGKGEGGLRGVCVGVCGPVGLADEVVAAVRGVGRERRAGVGGVEVVEEVFGW
ncbi:hypothetical protein HWV62_42705 [Athelia sp. TMB]|nr:hypothetical protein HWV62_42705 [Athelia sp. TMB]